MKPLHLVFTPINTCLICGKIDKNIKCRMTNIFLNMGFQYCNSCAIEIENDVLIFSEYVKDMFKSEVIKVIRGSGEIDDGWRWCGWDAYKIGDTYRVDVFKGNMMKSVDLTETVELNIL